MVFAVQPRKFEPRKTLLVALVLVVLFVVLLTREQPGPPHLVFRGETMGTTYSIKIAHSPLSVREVRSIHGDILLQLKEINRQMSTYLPDSEISRVNQTIKTEAIDVSPEFVKVVQLACHIGDRTEGAFDITLKPLIDAWGFGPGQTNGTPKPPAEHVLAHARKRIGYQKLDTPSDHQIKKSVPNLEISLDGIAKGYAVDVVAQLIRSNGLENIFVEIGGEIAAYGVSTNERPWRIGIERPKRGSMPGSTLSAIVEVSGFTVATSGDYRNFFQDSDGTYYTHIIDPRTSQPVRHQLASVTVIADQCAVADGVATALFAMGDETGFEWIETQKDLSALFVIRKPDGTYSNRISSGFAEKTKYQAIRN